jgi:hypothetical protein
MSGKQLITRPPMAYAQTMALGGTPFLSMARPHWQRATRG